MSQSFRGDKQRREQLPPGIPGRSSTHFQTDNYHLNRPRFLRRAAPGRLWLRSSRQHSAGTRRDQPGWGSSFGPQHPRGAARTRS